jgi:hypothetical protein
VNTRQKNNAIILPQHFIIPRKEEEIATKLLPGPLPFGFSQRNKSDV